ncbi:hypothetical protein [Halalkalibacter urbisdiaboli]|uniref:hypothetical protein n=1 Tax=Halalkalibacter urbisdiaboli TaxID=1960589 RepID=UPI000B43AD99|nr:hypothetical protein [Halalkalibacter urbisdiaboli]
MSKGLTEQEWVYEYYHSGKRKPVVLGSKGTWIIGGQKAIILVSFSIQDINVLKDIYQISSKHPVRTVTYKNLTYYAVNIIEEKAVIKIMKSFE